jgi:Lrp/AsnC family transcriptional regulator
MMDKTDRKIIRLLQEQPEMTLRDLADAAGLSHSPCWRRIQKLQKAGILSERRYLVDAQAAGYEILVFCLVRMAHHKREYLSAFEDAVAAVPEILQCYSLSGEHDYILQVIAHNVKDYEATVKNALVQLPHVQTISTSFTLKRVKETANVPV